MISKFNPRTNRFERTNTTSPTTTVPTTTSGTTTTTTVPTTTTTAPPKTRAPKVRAPKVKAPKPKKKKKTPTPTPGGNDPLLTTLTEWLNGQTLTPEQSASLNALGLGGSGGSGSSGPSAAQKKASANIQTQAGKKAQAQYNAMAAKFMRDSQAETGQYYAGQQAQANSAIDAATKSYLENLINPTAYSNVPIAQLTPQQQGLMSNLQAYGATGQQAQQQQTQDAGFNQFISQLLSNSTQQLQQADTGYFNALRNAGIGGQAAARTAVAQNANALQGQSAAQAEAIRRQLMQAGIDALMTGQTNAANTLAS